MPTEAEKQMMSERVASDKLKKGEESYENLKRERYLDELKRARAKKMKREEEKEKKAKAKAIQDNVDVDKLSEAEETDEETRKEKKKEDAEKEKRKEDRKRKMEGSLYLLFYLRFLVFLKFIWRYISDMKNIKNRKLFSEAEQEFEEGWKRRKESLCAFDTLFKIDPTIMDTFTEEVALPRVKKNLSSHMKTALWPMAISRYGHFIMVQVENCYGAARVIRYVVLYRGYGTGSIKNSSVCFKKHKCFTGRALKKMPEWHLQKIDLNELKNIGQMGMRYQTPEAGLEPDEDKDMKMARTNENRVLVIEDEQDIFRRQYLRLKHYQDGNLINVVMGTYRVAEGERNVMVVKDTMCLRRATKKDEIARRKWKRSVTCWRYSNVRNVERNSKC